MKDLDDLGPDLKVGLLLANQIDNFGKTQTENSFPAPLDIFESGVVRVMSSVDEYVEADSSDKLEIKKEREFMHDISDIRSELIMMNEILLEQERIVTSVVERLTSLVKKYKPKLRLWDHDLLSRVENAKKQLKTYQDRVKKIDIDAERVEKTIQDQLNLKRTFATIKDTHTSVQLGEASIKLGEASLLLGKSSLLIGTAVAGFTIVTIIFAPIAFMATLFALPIDKLHQHQVNDVFETKYIARWFGMRTVDSTRKRS